MAGKGSVVMKSDNARRRIASLLFSDCSFHHSIGSFLNILVSMFIIYFQSPLANLAMYSEQAFKSRLVVDGKEVIIHKY